MEPITINMQGIILTSPAENKFDLELSSKVFSLLNHVQ